MADVDRVVKTYIKIRDKKHELKKEYDEAVSSLDSQLEVLRLTLLEHCKDTNEESGRTEHGTYSRIVRQKYWTSDWEAFGKFIIDHKAPELLEKRVQQTNMKEFVKDHPDIDVPGLQVDATYDIVVRRPPKK